MDYDKLDHLFEGFMRAGSMELGRDFPESEYKLRLRRARELMQKHGFDALIVTTSTNGGYFTSLSQPHEWHDLCPTRASFFILTMDDDILFMPPGLGGEHLNYTRRKTWVTNIRNVVERHFENVDRVEVWSLSHMIMKFEELGLSKGRLGWELGDCQTLGISYNDLNEFKRLLPDAKFLDASPLLRRLHQIPTPLQLERIEKACAAGVKMHDQVTDIVRVGMTERKFAAMMQERFRQLRFGDGYSYGMWEEGLWGYHDVRNPKHPELNVMGKFQLTDRPFMEGDVFNRMTSGMSYLGVDADVDRTFYVGKNPPAEVAKWYRVTSICNEVMGNALRPGIRCAEVFEIRNRAAKENGLPERLVGRNGHWSNLSGLSIHPECNIVLEPGMVISVEPTFVENFGYFDVEDIYMITETGSKILHPPAPKEIPCCTN